MEISIAILCGGKSRRFGRDKTKIKIDKEPLFRIMYEKFSRFSADTFFQVSKHTDHIADNEHYDIIENKGPLGGIYSALYRARNDKLFVIACDLPLIDVNILRELRKHLEYDAVVPRWSNGLIEPLCAIYSKSLMKRIEEMIDKDILKVSRLFEKVKVKWVDIDALISKGIISKDSFRNVNREEDLVNLSI